MEHGLHNTQVSSWLTQQAYTFLQSNIPLERTPDYSVVIIDLSHLRSTNSLSPIESSPGVFFKSSQDFTDRQALKTLVQQISSYAPACIGIDIDFSPLTPDQGSDGRPPPGQIEFMDTCLGLKTPSGEPIPVFLGVMRTMQLNPEAWLDSKEYIPLAAAIARFRGRSSHMPSEIHANPEAASLFSLSKLSSAAWFKKHRSPPPQPPKWLKNCVRGESQEPIAGRAEDCWASAVPVDYYSTLPEIERSRIFAEDLLLSKIQPPELLKRLDGKIVLIGYATRLETFDTVSVPNEPDPVPGIYMHACAAATLISKPLFEINEATGYVLSFLISALIAFVIFKLRPESMHLGKMLAYELVSVVIAIFVSCLIAMELVTHLNVLWLQLTSVWLFLIIEFGLNILADWKHKEHNPG